MNAVLTRASKRLLPGPRTDTTGTQARSARIDYFDGIRAVAVLAVVAHHWVSTHHYAFQGGYIGVDVFFVLSGYIITKLLWRTALTPGRFGNARSWWQFIRRRARRLYPALLGMLVVCGSVYVLADGAAPLRTAGDALIAAAQLSSIAQATGSADVGPYGITWSLAVEWYFYLIWPLILFALRRRGCSAGRAALAAGGLAVTAYLLSLPLGRDWFYYGPTARAGEILAGGAVALYLTDRPRHTETPARWSRVASPLALGTIVVYAVAGPHWWNPLHRFGLLLVVGATCCLLFLGPAVRSDPGYRLLTRPSMTQIGRVSYSVYLWHYVPVFLLPKHGALGGPPVQALLSVTWTVITAGASYRWLERPFLGGGSNVLARQE